MKKKTPKVLYCNPIFLDYRIPFYMKLHELFQGNFFVLYGTNRYRFRYDRLLKHIQSTMAGVAFSFNGDHFFNPSTFQFDKVGGGGHFIPITIGLLKNIHKHKPDILISEGFFQWTPLVLLYSLIFKKPLFIGYERTLWTERNIGKFKTWHRKLTDKFVTGYLVNGSETKKYLMSIGVKDSKIYIGGMNADGEGLRESIRSMNAEEKAEIRNRYNTEGLLYLFCGQIIKRKGVAYLLEAWVNHVQRHSKDTLILVGGGELLDEFKRCYANFPSIHLEGRVEYTHVYKYYAVADVFILPTIEDNWSLVIPEAMSCGLPVSTSIYNGCHPELVKKGVNGITFDTFKQESILEALDYFHHVDLKAFGQKSIELEKEFNTENCAKRVYDALISVETT